MSSSSEHTETVRRLIGGTEALERKLIDAIQRFLDERDQAPRGPRLALQEARDG